MQFAQPGNFISHLLGLPSQDRLCSAAGIRTQMTQDMSLMSCQYSTALMLFSYRLEFMLLRPRPHFHSPSLYHSFHPVHVELSQYIPNLSQIETSRSQRPLAETPPLGGPGPLGKWGSARPPELRRLCALNPNQPPARNCPPRKKKRRADPGIARERVGQRRVEQKRGHRPRGRRGPPPNPATEEAGQTAPSLFLQNEPKHATLQA